MDNSLISCSVASSFDSAMRSSVCNKGTILATFLLWSNSTLNQMYQFLKEQITGELRSIIPIAILNPSFQKRSKFRYTDLHKSNNETKYYIWFRVHKNNRLKKRLTFCMDDRPGIGPIEPTIRLRSSPSDCCKARTNASLELKSYARKIF